MSLSKGVWRRVLITGARGFVGARLVAALHRHGFAGELALCGGPNDTQGQWSCDMRNPDDVMRVVRDFAPTAIVHLAAIAAVTAANRDVRQAWDVNLGGTLNLIEAMKAHAPDARLLFVSSAEIYGRSFLDHHMVDETASLLPVNPYAASKAAADILARQSAYNGIDAIIARPFNHTGAGQSEAFVAPAFAAQIARIEAGLQPPVLKVGNLDDERDFLDVDDVVDAYIAMLAMENPQPGETFNIASGWPLHIREILDQMLASSSVAIRVDTDANRLRPAPIPRVVGNAAKARSRLNWRPSRDMKTCFTQILDDWRQRVTVE